MMRRNQKRTLYFLSDEGLRQIENRMSVGRGLTLYQLRELACEGRNGCISLPTIDSILKRKHPSYYKTIRILFEALKIEFGAKDIVKAGDTHHDNKVENEIVSRHCNEGASVDNETLKLWNESEQSGEIATIHSINLNGYPIPYQFSRVTNIGLSRFTLGRVGAISLIGAWWGKEPLLRQYQDELLSAGQLSDVVTRGSAWEPCAESDAPPADSPLWQAIPTPMGVEPAGFVAWGGNSMAWLKTPDGFSQTNPRAEFVTKTMKVVEIDGQLCRFSQGVARVA
jgi:hypothetical protein